MILIILAAIALYYHIQYLYTPTLEPSKPGYSRIQLASVFLDFYQFRKFLGNPEQEVIIFWSSAEAEYYCDIPTVDATDYLEKLKKVLPECYYGSSTHYEFLTTNKDLT